MDDKTVLRKMRTKPSLFPGRGLRALKRAPFVLRNTMLHRKRVSTESERGTQDFLTLTDCERPGF